MSEPGSRPARRVRIFQSYGRADAAELARRLRADLEARDFEVWQDIERLYAGAEWDAKIREALRNSEAVIAILSPHATRAGPDSADQLDSVCLDEIAFARFASPPRPIVPVMAIACEPPLTIYRLHYVDMQGWERSESRYAAAFEELVAAVEKAISGEPQLRRFVLALNPDERLAAFLDSRRQDFTGREWLFAEIDRWRDRSDERMLLITGDPGCGKSALVADLVHRNPDSQVVAYHCCIAGVPTTLSAGEFVRSIAAMLASQIPAYADAIERGGVLERLTDAERDPTGAFQFGVVAPLVLVPPPEGPPRYILVDGLDEALVGDPGGAPVTIPDLLTSRLGSLPGWLRVVATSRRSRAVLEKLGAARELPLDAHDARNLADVRGYLEARLQAGALAELVERSGLAVEDVLGSLCQLAEGSFVYARTAADALAHGSLELGEIERQPRGLAELYETSFRRTFAEPGSYPPCAELLAVLLAARRGLGRDQLEAILGIPAVELERRLAALEGYLTRVEDGYSIFHKSFADWLTDPAVGTTEFHVETADGERSLLAWCRRWPDLDDGYPPRYLPLHLAAAGAADELLALLLDPAFARRRETAGITPLTEVEDHVALTSLLLDRGRGDDIVRVAQTASPYRRDGVAAALRAAGDRHEQAVHEVVERLATLGGGGRSELPPATLNARTVAIETATERGYADVLLLAALDDSPAVRATLVPHLYRFWEERGEDGWALLDSLGEQLTGRFGAPRADQIEITGGLTLAILTRDHTDAATIARLGAFWRTTARRAVSTPLMRIAGKGLALKAAIGALTVVMRDQPEYQPLNLRELRHTFPGPADHATALAAVAALDRPEQGFGPVTQVLGDRTLEFDVFTMLVAERALVLHGARDPAAVLAAIEGIFATGCPWFRQSCLYSAFNTLAMARAPESGWLEGYAELTREFVAVDRASMRTAIGAYTFPPHLAWVEVAFARHRPTGRARFLPAFFRIATEADDPALCRTVITACHMLSLNHREPQLALDALRDIAPEIPGDSPLAESLVDALANIRLLEDASVDRFLRRLGDRELARRVAAATPSVRANEFPSGMDSFVNHLLVSSEEFRVEMCAAFRRAARVGSVRELLYDSTVWVLAMLVGEDAPQTLGSPA